MPVAKIISIPYMAQAMMATVLLKPDSARARPSTLINSDTEYKKIFSLDLPIDIYLKVIQIMKAVEIYLKPDNCGVDIDRKTTTNVKFYAAMMVSIKMADGKNDIPSKLSAIPSINVTQDLLSESLNRVLQEFNELGATDQVAKGSELVAKLLS